jgi:MFS family permease
MSSPHAPAGDSAQAVTRRQHAAVTVQIVSIVSFTFVAYLSIGLPLAVLPGYVHGQLGYGSILAGFAISCQYVATLLSRPLAGRMADSVGAKRTVMVGLCACALSGALLIGAALARPIPWVSLILLLASRLVLGCGESCVGTGAIIWGIGRVGLTHTARVISWNGITTYGALALGAPLGVLLEGNLGLASIGVVICLIALGGVGLASLQAPIAVVHGERLPFRHVFNRILPHGIGLALGSTGFGSIATFITLYYASRHWSDPAFSLTVFGLLFVGTRLLFANAIRTHGGFRVAIASFFIEAAGLLLLWLAPIPGLALVGAALTGCGFALVFPALGVEAVGLVPPASRGAALGGYSLFLDMSLGITGPLAGLIAGAFGYAQVFLFAAAATIAGLVLTCALLASVQKQDDAPLPS